MPYTVGAPALGRPQGIAERRLKQQLKLVAQHRVFDTGYQPQPLLQVADSGVRRTTERKIAGLKPVIDRGFSKTGFAKVVSHDFRLAHHNVGKFFLHRARDLAVQSLPAALEQALVRRIPYQRVLEAIDGFRRLTSAEHKLSLLQSGESKFQRRF